PRDVPAPPPRPRGGRARRHLPVRLQRRERGRRRRVPRGTPAVPRHRRRRRGHARRRRRRTRARPRRADRGRHRGSPPDRGSLRRMTIFVAILGLGFLILIHEAGHFFTAIAVGMRPRRFYLGFPPAVAKKKWRGIEYGVGAIPLGG